MRIPCYAAAFVMALAPVVSPAPLRAGAPLKIQVTPTLARAPAVVTVRAQVDASSDNRRLQIIASSANFYRSSEIELDGPHTVPVNIFEFRNLPSGLYEVTAVLVGTHGPRATVSTLAKIEPPFGSQ
jgi:hypothetical protein